MKHVLQHAVYKLHCNVRRINHSICVFTDIIINGLCSNKQGPCFEAVLCVEACCVLQNTLSYES
jgi:hypothetical protein